MKTRARIRQVMDQLLDDGAPVVVPDGENVYTLTHRDVEEIMEVYGCDEDAARDRLAEWLERQLYENS